jgi:hypothetical protein
VRDVPVEIAGHEQVQLAVIIVIEELADADQLPPATPASRLRR